MKLATWFSKAVALALVMTFTFGLATPVSTAARESLNYEDLSDFENALRGRISQLEPPVIHMGSDESGVIVYDLRDYDFIPTIDKPEDYDPESCPETVDSSLWRQAQLNKIHGLFQVVPGVYQVRGYDLANLTIVESNSGIIVMDCMTTGEAARASLDLYGEYKGNRPVVKAVIVSHSHVDHYGGIGGVLEYAAEDVQIYAPEGFMEEAISENAFAGDAMTRRSSYQYGAYLMPGENGVVDAGLGKVTTKGGQISIVEPTVTVTDAKSDYTIDGVDVEFMLCPNTEAPAEMTVYLKNLNVLFAAEIVTHTIHNILTPRGAPVRDARLWWKAIDRLIQKYGGTVEVLCAPHHWPTWGNQETVTLLEQQRDMYKFLHDQTVRLMNKGYTMLEIAAEFEKPGFLPEFMASEWNARGYYGTISHNVRAIYQRYIGWYDMNPSNLNPLPPEEAAAEYVKALGGEASAKAQMEKALAEGSYRWAAELGKHLVFANPSKENRDLLATAYEKLGYEAEAGTWRNMYLVGAAELRNNGPIIRLTSSTVNVSTLNAMDDSLFFDFIASRFMAERAMASVFEFDINQTDRESSYRVLASRGVLNFHENAPPPETNDEKTGAYAIREFIKLELDRETFVDLIMKTNGYTLQNAIQEGKAAVIGYGGVRNNPEDISYAATLFELVENTLPNFNIVTP